MLFADISKSLGELAGAIAKKNKEVEELKSEYERKLRVVERYLQHFPGAELALDANALVTLLEKPNRSRARTVAPHYTIC